MKKVTVQPIYFIVYKNEKYLDFSTLLYLYTNTDKSPSSKRATLWRHLKKNKKIKKVKILNKIIYPLEDLLDDTQLLSNMDNIIELLPIVEN